MPKIKINYSDSIREVSVSEGILLEQIKKAGVPIAAPCGGKGTCGKCRVFVSGKGGSDLKEVLACKEYVKDDILVKIPDPAPAMILSESYWPDIDIKWNDQDDGGAFGIAVDIGTTTVVVYLEDLAGRKNIAVKSFLNPQSSYGADVISRIQYVMQNPDTLNEQKALITGTIYSAIKDLAKENSVPLKEIRTISIAGNNPMLHLFTGTDPGGLAVFPFTPVFTDEQKPDPADLGFAGLDNAMVILLPSLSAYVGADIIAGIASTELTESEGYSLFLDIGTNGEMALGNQDRILTCATAAGPAFEGAKISCGLGGVEGAVHSFSKEGFETIGSVSPSGLCGSGLVDVVAWMLDSGQLDPTGYMENDFEFIEAVKSTGGKALSLTPQDIREVQLAKGAIAAGIKTLMSEAGIDEDQIDRLYLAGGFGYALHVESACRIGLIPDSLKDKVIRAGNLAGLGARLALHSDEFRKRIVYIRDRAEYFELSNHMGFNESFVMEMMF